MSKVSANLLSRRLKDSCPASCRTKAVCAPRRAARASRDLLVAEEGLARAGASSSPSSDSSAPKDDTPALLALPRGGGPSRTAKTGSVATALESLNRRTWSAKSRHVVMILVRFLSRSWLASRHSLRQVSRNRSCRPRTSSMSRAASMPLSCRRDIVVVVVVVMAKWVEG